MKCIFVLIYIPCLLFSASEDPTFGKNGMIVSTSRQASEAGVEILKKGGNAIDAAVAVGFALAVTSSGNGNLGGGGFLVAAMKNGDTFTIDHREKAPKRSKKSMYLDDVGNIIDGMSLYSRASSGVPGTVDGLLKALNDHGSGTISRQQILAPAIRLAGKGFKLSHFEAERFNVYKEFFERNNAAKKIFVKEDNTPWKEGDLFKQKDLEKTLKKISKYGRSGFYSGTVASLIVNEMNKGNGIISLTDLEEYSSIYRDPVVGTYKSYKIMSMGPPSSGGVLLINMLNMLEEFSLDTMGWNSSDYFHLLTEVERRAYADRAIHLGDPDFWENPIKMLTSKDYAKNRIRNIDLNRATPSSEISASKVTDYESAETTHYSVVDQWGNAVSITTTINLNYGNGHVVEGAGFFLNNEMDDFSSKPGSPNAFGLIGNEANAIEANKRPLSSMTPTIVLKEDSPYIIIGSPGGSTIITTVMQSILNIIEYDMDIKKAVSAPRFHSQWLPDVIQIEPHGIIKDVLKNLKKRGHKVSYYRGGYIGEANGIIIGENGYYGGGDSRGETSAVGY